MTFQTDTTKTIQSLCYHQPIPTILKEVSKKRNVHKGGEGRVDC